MRPGVRWRCFHAVLIPVGGRGTPRFRPGGYSRELLSPEDLTSDHSSLRGDAHPCGNCWSHNSAPRITAPESVGH
jgi:hypothetical protein